MNIKLWNGCIPYETEGFDTPNNMTTYFLETEEPLPCVVVLPGGGYSNRAAHEGEPIAKFFNSRNMHAVVVDYRVAPNRFPTGLCDAQRAIRLLRANAQEWKIDPQRIVSCGFSAGGHLAASVALYDDMLPEDWKRDDADGYSCVSNGAILAYSVIAIDGEFGHVGSGKNLLGEERFEREASDFALQNKVCADSPKFFLWHTSNDSCVNVKNSLVFAEHLRDSGIEFEMHIYPDGNHGLGLALQKPDAKAWAGLAADWIVRNI
ncbi:MAG: alpha/beta hydrolase [Eubacteriales bacterium]